MGKSVTFFMQGGKRAPSSINADDEGPSIGLTTGYTMVRPSGARICARKRVTLNENGVP